jgi:hypothetical protein
LAALVFAAEKVKLVGFAAADLSPPDDVDLLPKEEDDNAEK